jgi:hypothetical protein
MVNTDEQEQQKWNKLKKLKKVEKPTKTDVQQKLFRFRNNKACIYKIITFNGPSKLMNV